MNREILFRGKRIDGKGWAYGNLCKCENFIGDIFYEIGYGKKYYRVIPSTVGQFTGLTDKNGAKIFEGDTVTGLHGGKYVCVFRENGAFEFKNLLTFNFVMLHDIWGSKITGTIHDNPTP